MKSVPFILALVIGCDANPGLEAEQAALAPRVCIPQQTYCDPADPGRIYLCNASGTHGRPIYDCARNGQNIYVPENPLVCRSDAGYLDVNYVYASPTAPA